MKRHNEQSTGQTEENIKTKNLEMAKKRLTRCRDTTTNEHARKWYSTQLEALKEKPTTRHCPNDTETTPRMPKISNTHRYTDNSQTGKTVAEEGWTIVRKKKGSGIKTP